MLSLIEPRVSTPSKFDHKATRPYFAWLPLDRIKKTFEMTTQFMKMPSSTYLQKRHQTLHPAANIIRRNEKVMTDTVYFDTPAVDGGETAAQIYTGRSSEFTSVHVLKGESKDDLLGTFQDRFRWHGAPHELGSNNVVVYLGN